ncbi:bacteriocin fulvocin C-related protein [Actinopolyspora halophila]|uniref:bacteriocin fulvocin C-related protein n=1 Tax=Actinopolyspora halophila TaxID=1850 RepID=UPI0012F99B83|nr:bacteriocin fulvocin C-related protein [Actinopolyspora halophila]
MTNTFDRWVLAFDGSCRVCRNMSRAVAEACGDKLEVLPLTHPDVREWREQALGANPVWAPTLIRVRSGRVRAWVGVPLGFALVRHLGLRSTLAVLGALGRTRRTTHRRRLGALPLIAGLAVAASLTKLDPYSGGRNGDDPSAWAEANRERLPQSYGEVVEYSMVYRQAIFNASSAATKSRLWVEHLRQYGATHPDLSQDQERVLRHAMDVLGDESLYAQSSPPEQDRVLGGLRQEVAAAFGEETQSLIATLGPPELATKADWNDCQCSTSSDYCWMGCVGSDNCRRIGGCGTGWVYTCNGWCEGP